MKVLVLATILLPIAASAQQVPPPVQALSALLQECDVREANARVGAAMFQADITLLKGVNEDLKKELRAARDNSATGDDRGQK